MFWRMERRFRSRLCHKWVRSPEIERRARGDLSQVKKASEGLWMPSTFALRHGGWRGRQLACDGAPPRRRCCGEGRIRMQSATGDNVDRCGDNSLSIRRCVCVLGNASSLFPVLHAKVGLGGGVRR